MVELEKKIIIKIGGAWQRESGVWAQWLRGGVGNQKKITLLEPKGIQSGRGETRFSFTTVTGYPKIL